MVSLLPGQATGPLQRIGKMTQFPVVVEMILRFTLNASVGTTIVNLGTLLGLRDGVHYQIGKLDWDFAVRTDPVDSTYEVWLLHHPSTSVPENQDSAGSAQLAYMIQAFRIGAGTLTVSKTNLSEITEVDIGIQLEDLDDALFIAARAESTATFRVSGTLLIEKTFIQRSWPQSKVSQIVAATA